VIEAVQDCIALFFRIVGAICFFLSATFAGVALFNFVRDLVDWLGDWLAEWIAKND
jgi:hypothetical protein